MSSYNYSYNVLINRLEAFAAGHFLIKRFTHGQIDLADDLQDDQYPFMHVVPERIAPVDGGMQFDFLIMFADIPRDKEYKAEYQREVISDCVRLGQDLIAEVKNGLQLFGFDVQLTNNPTFEPFMEEYKNTITGVTFTLSLEVPWDWSACDIPAVWSVGGSSTGGSGTGYGITLQTNGVNNALQNLLNLEAGANIIITDNGNGTITIDSTGGGGGGSGTVTSVGLSVPSPANAALSVSGSPVTTSGTLAISANGTSSEYIDGTGALQTFPSIPQSLIDLIAGTQKGDLIEWDGNNWAIIPGLSLDDITDVALTTPSNGQVLEYNGTSWVNVTPASGGTVTSVALTTPAAFNVTGSPITTSGTLAITGAGTSAEYVDGTGALQTFPALTGFVPYTGATQDVDLDTNKLSASSVYIEGTAGNGHLHLKHQSADATATGQSTSLWADTNGDIKWKNDGNYKTTLKTSSNTADRVYTFPNETAELMPRNAAITGATKTKITYDSDGLVTAGADLAATDIPSGIDATKIGSGAVDNTEFGYLNGVTSDIQTQLNNKKDTFTIRMQVAGQSPADATTYYVGEISVSLNTNATLYRTTMPYASKLIGAVISAINTSAGSTTEASTINFRLNNTTDTLLSNAVAFGNNLTVNVYTITGLNVAVAANDTFNIKWTTPTWATNPTGATLLVTLYFERT
jgi:hypothetical protein